VSSEYFIIFLRIEVNVAHATHSILTIVSYSDDGGSLFFVLNSNPLVVLCVVDLFFGFRVARESSADCVGKLGAVFSYVRHEEWRGKPGLRLLSRSLFYFQMF